MQMSVDIAGAAKLGASFIDSRELFLRAAERVVFAEATAAVERIQRDRRSGGPGNVTTATQTKVVTGRLRQSYGAEVRRTGRGIEGRVGILRATRAPEYAGVHEFGSDRAGRGHTTHIPARPALVPEGNTAAARIAERLPGAFVAALLRDE